MEKLEENKKGGAHFRAKQHQPPVRVLSLADLAEVERIKGPQEWQREWDSQFYGEKNTEANIN